MRRRERKARRREQEEADRQKRLASVPLTIETFGSDEHGWTAQLVTIEGTWADLFDRGGFQITYPRDPADHEGSDHFDVQTGAVRHTWVRRVATGKSERVVVRAAEDLCLTMIGLGLFRGAAGRFLPGEGPVPAAQLEPGPSIDQCRDELVELRSSLKDG